MSLYARSRPLWPSVLLALSGLVVPISAQAADERAGAQAKRADQATSQAAGQAANSAPQAETLGDDRSRFSYMIGVDVGRDLAKAKPDIDFASFRKAVENAFSGGEPLLDENASREVSVLVIQRTAARSGRPVPGLPPGAKAPPVAKDKVGLLLGTDVGRSLAPVASEIDVDVFMQAARSAASGEPLLLDDARIEALRQEFAARMQAKAESEAVETAAEGERFLARNRSRPGVIVTRSGLQYQVLRQGSGLRPRATDRVRVNYRGTLLDGTEFDSSYARGTPAEFALNRVIAGWTEGVGLMPVGAKYKLWIPAVIAYGARGSGSVPPNATLVFEVELLDIL